ncbi:hypothetical protein ACIBSV_23700 [Embleya sp. NPDC050154]|uniref:hypothetical protein n=1 Tax=Embleya sp. NPDC050154 TaxID=3363988 RepID=UPI0037B2E89D
MSKTAIIALLAELNDADGMIFARIRDEMPAALRDTEVLPPSVVLGALRAGDDAALFAIAGNLGLPRGALPELYTGPALPTLRALRSLAPGNPRAYTEATRGIRESMARHLGGSAPAWGRLLASLPTFAGPLSAAIEAAGAGEEAPGLRVPVELRVEFRHLLLLAPPACLAELLPALPPYIVRDLLRFGARVPDAVLADVIARATPAQCLALARARRTRPEVAGALLALADPATNAALYLNPRTGQAIRARIMASSTPLHPTLVERVCNDWASTIRLPALWSGDPLLVRAALLNREAMAITLPECLTIWQDKGIEGLRAHLRTLPPRGDGTRPRVFRSPRYRSLLLIALLRLYECAGARAALDLLDDLEPEPRLADRCRDLLTSPAADTELRAWIARSIGDPPLVRRLRRYVPAFEWPMLETSTPDWARIGRAHRRSAFPPRALALLAEQDGCPDELRREIEFGPPSAQMSRCGPWPAPVQWWDPRSRRRGEAEFRIASDLAAGRLPIAEVLTGRRATLAAELLGLRETILPDTRTACELRDGFRELIDSQVEPADRAAFAAVALRLLPHFEGSLAELVTTAAGAARG